MAGDVAPGSQSVLEESLVPHFSCFGSAGLVRGMLLAEDPGSCGRGCTDGQTLEQTKLLGSGSAKG